MPAGLQLDMMHNFNTSGVFDPLLEAMSTKPDKITEGDDGSDQSIFLSN